MPAEIEIRGDAYRRALGHLRGVLEATGKGDYADLSKIVGARDEVLSGYGSLFRREAIPNLTAEEFRSFLLFRNNHHWTGLQRQAKSLTADMGALRSALMVLLDESRSIRDRIDAVLTSAGSAKVHGLGKAVATPILLCAYPDKYGVWNGPSQRGMDSLGLLPTNERGLTEGEKYERINNLLLQLRDDLGTDLWTLDALWWRLGTPSAAARGAPEYTLEEFEEAVGTLEELPPSDLDIRREVAVRIEQTFLRQHLFKKQKEARCALCGKDFPVKLLRTAHVKPRSQCSPEERLDFENIVVPMCTFGCDELFERGYIVIRQGAVEIIPRPRTPAVDDYLATLKDRQCPMFYGDRRPYFEWHADWHSREDRAESGN
jgi:hypothetical protein